ncbi:glycoside hydrolase family 3 N-terminal domain-containing protein [Psychroflexus sediminis]|uniref:beta-N-acetylhexosaminidase n=1 Tax=Psychroflexus sediminis TaxID=470826 RepID=A0A1G7YP29_9FLAO|nr:glycoside hydrolase family 3 N-terminal domain-containing protein [Psychroflexus sediminis]SDG98197.1 beta-glucosidase [Psychroflexus sediminis]
MSSKIYSKVVFLMAFFSFTCVLAQNSLFSEDINSQRKWVDSLYSNLSLEEKIGQLFMIDVFTNKSDAELENIADFIKTNHIGGVIFSKGNPYRQAQFTNKIQTENKVPLLIGMDAEWGLAMRLDSTYAFPWNMTLGAIKDTSIVRKVGNQIGKHNKRLGVHINFAPVADINTNPENPIIGNRSFGETKEVVISHAVALMKGMHDAGILTSAKHFPGHGDTQQDSHLTLPTIDFSEQRIRAIELEPFRALINEGVSSIMVAHLNVPSLESRSDFPSSLSPKIVSQLLKEELGFKGLVITDALNMKGVSNNNIPGEVDLKAFQAGSDILLISENVPKAIEIIKKAIKNNKIAKSRLAYSVKKILYAKYKVGLNNFDPIETTHLTSELNSGLNDAVYKLAIENATTVLKNDLGILPISDVEHQKIGYLGLGDASGETFYEALNRYAAVERIENKESILNKNSKLDFDHIIIGYHRSDINPWTDYKFTPYEIKCIEQLSRENKVTLVNFSRPYSLLGLQSFINIDAIFQVYQNSDIAQSVAAQQIFGALETLGNLPVSITSAFPVGTGYKLKSNGRLGQGYYQNLGFDERFEKKVDSIANYALDEKMTPGMQILIARKGKIIYDKNFGYHTYDKKNKVQSDDVYDLASLTKILTTLPILMTLEEASKLSLNTKLHELIPALASSNKADISVLDMLSHYARLEPWIPFYQNTLEEKSEYYASEYSEEFSIKVLENMYLRTDYQDSIYSQIVESELRDTLEYKYSDLPYYFLKKFIEQQTDNSLDTLAETYFYRPMGLSRLKFFPLNHFDKEKIVPTENDTVWRQELIHGTVHDQGAAMLGGVGGHAGLFGNARDVASFMQLYLNKGDFGGKIYFSPQTMTKFNTCYYCDKEVRRGVGFDKPQLDDIGPTCGCLSMSSFGHSGFTGTYAWADPEEEIIYIFLSNRIHPDPANTKLIDEDIRTKIQGLIYENLSKDY